MKWPWPLVLLLACHRDNDKSIDKTAAATLFDTVELENVPAGLSDLTIDDAGALWSIPERDRHVVRLVDNKPTTFPLEGVAPGLDTEALAWLGDHRFVVGLEGAHDATAAIAYATSDGTKLVVDKPNTFSPAELGVTPTINHGIEALCGHGDDILAATEIVHQEPDGTRWAALIRIHGADTKFGKVRLTSTKGKLSALSCTFADDGTVEVFAIERHYGVVRIVEFHVGTDLDATAKLVLDLQPVLHDALNLEGIARLPNGKLVLINDNQGRAASGPTDLLYLR
jgi:hypothetical protein